MDYLNSIQCKKEPFAATTGGDVYLSQPIRDSFEKLTHSIRLGAGLHIVTGADGFGKTTLVHQLSGKFSADKNTIVLAVNKPQFSNLQQFLTTLAGAFKGIKPPAGIGDKKLQQAFNTFFHNQCLQDKTNVLLLIDNGQALPDFCLQALDGIYGYHADCRRLLQTVICGDASLQKKLQAIKTVNSRIAFTINLKPFSFKETRELIRFHVKQAAANPDSPPPLFSGSSQWAIYRLCQGNPKKIIDLCHFIVLSLIIENRKSAEWFMTLRCANLLVPKRAKRLQLIRAGSASSLIILMLVFGLWSEPLKTLTSPPALQPARPPVAKKVVPPKLQPQEQGKIEPEIAQQDTVKEIAGPEPASEKEVAAPEGKEQIAAVEPTGETAPISGERTEGKTAPQEIPSAPEPDAEIAAIITPTIQKKLEVVPGDTFLLMMQKVYGPGHLKPYFIEQVISANPHLKDTGSLVVGDEIFFPVLAPEEEKPAAIAGKTVSLVARKLDRDLQPVDAPGLIGKLPVEPGDTMGGLIRGIYGPFSFNPDYAAKVLAVNTHLKNPDNLEVGETIYFPDLPITPEVGLPAKPTYVASRGEIPDFLGEIIAIEGETFGDMVRKIYGPYSFNSENVKKVLAVNPGYKNPSLMSVGQKIRFPTILVALSPDAPVAWWVKIITLDNLQSAYRFLRVYSKWAPPMLIIPSRNDKGQVLFNVLLQGYFADELSAQKALNELPAAITTDAKPLHGLNPNTFYYWTKQNN